MRFCSAFARVLCAAGLLAVATPATAGPAEPTRFDVCVEGAACTHLAVSGSGANLTLAPTACAEDTGSASLCAFTIRAGADAASNAGASSGAHPVAGTCSLSGTAGSKVNVQVRANAQPAPGATVTGVSASCYVHVNGVHVATVTGSAGTAGTVWLDALFKDTKQGDVVTVCLGDLRATWSDGHSERLADC